MMAGPAYPGLAYLGIGSNLGDRRRNIADALRMLSESGHVKVGDVSSLYETKPVGYTEQGRFLNAVAKVACDLSPAGLLSLCQDIEARLGRERTIRWGPRTIDIDILSYFEQRRNSGEEGSSGARDGGADAEGGPGRRASAVASIAAGPGGTALSGTGPRDRRGQRDGEGAQDDVQGAGDARDDQPPSEQPVIPHPRMWQRGFVIIPLAEIAPDLISPDGRTTGALAWDPRMQEGVSLYMTGPWWKNGRAASAGAQAQDGRAQHVETQDGGSPGVRVQPSAMGGASARRAHAQDTRLLGQTVHRFTEVDSTNAVARRLAEAGAPEGTCVVAETQTAGRGRMGRTWHSPPGGLWFSVVLRPHVVSRDIGKLSLVTGVAVVEAVREATGLLAMMKWPNDVAVHGKKVCGVLVEGRWRGEAVDYIVEGIGINVAVDLLALPPEVRTSAGTLVPPGHPGAAALRERLLALVLEKLGLVYRGFLSGGFLDILEKARLYSDTLGRDVEAACPGGPVRGTALDIDGDGALVVRTFAGDVRVVSGDVSVRCAGGGYSG